jgi:hypothetical protein
MGVIFDDSLVVEAAAGLSTGCLPNCTGLILSSRMLCRRIPYDLLGDDR